MFQVNVIPLSKLLKEGATEVTDLCRTGKRGLSELSPASTGWEFYFTDIITAVSANPAILGTR